MKLASGSSNIPLAENIAKKLGIPMVSTQITRFANGEKRVYISDDLEGENICLVQSFSHPTDEHIMEFLLLTDALERLGVRHINLLVPWMGYSLQDKVFRSGEPIAAKVVANLISNSYVKRAYLLDVHNSSIPGFFSIPTHHLTASKLFANYIKENFGLNKSIIVSPDFGGIKRARVFADSLGLELANIDKHRDLTTGEVTALGLHGSVSGKIALLFDDIVLSGSTLVEVAKLLKQRGATQVHAIVTHGIFSENAIKKLEESDLDSIVITNSINHEKTSAKIKILDSSDIFVEPIKKWL